MESVYVYVYDGNFKTGEAGYDLIKLAAVKYGMELKLDLPLADGKIEKSEKGKPYFQGLPIEFSLTHSGKLWMCMFSEKTCGLDLQIQRECAYEKIAERNFTKEEQHFVNLWGSEGFFQIWVRKEAFCKCTGQGFFSDMPSVINEDGDLAEKLNWEGKEYFFSEIDISEDIKCAVCTYEKINIEMRILG